MAWRPSKAASVCAWSFLALVFAGCQRADPDAPSTAVDLGSLIAGTDIVYTFKVLNPGKEPFRIIAVDKSCSCQDVTFDSDAMIPPGKIGTIAVKIGTKGFEGKKHWQFTAHTKTQADEREAVPLSLDAEIIARLKVIPSAISFGAIQTGSAVPAKKLVICEMGADVASKFTGFEIRQGHSAVRVTRRQLSPPGTINLDVSVAENAPVGDLNATLLLRFSDPDIPLIEVPVAGRIEGTLFTTPRLVTFDTSQAFIPTVKLSAKDGRPFKILKADADGPLSITASTEDGSDHLYKISCSESAQPGKYTAVFHTDLEDQKTICLPVVIQKN